jgi:hypothetical protein
MVKPSWDDVFGDLDVRTLDHDERLDFLNTEIERTLAGKAWAALSGGDEAQLVWDAAIRSFLDGIWVAAILCAHAVAERELAGVYGTIQGTVIGEPIAGWEKFGMGRLVTEVEKFGLLPQQLVGDLRQLAETRKPYGHWRSAVHDDALDQRVMAEHRATGNIDRANLVQRLIARDATHAMRTTIHLYFGSYGLGGP